MGQVQSDSSDANMEESSSAAKPTQESSSPASMESLMAGIFMFAFLILEIHSFLMLLVICDGNKKNCLIYDL